ncbi:hypothetical protein OIO90_002277 [Microbotryomycetes sp. JL221]|nr:hypothetical protein OIO90_002277 [Microbotryomycetes sp. JL221]
MTQDHDILRRVPASVPVLIVDSVLSALTHPRAWRRRLALLIIITLYIATLHMALQIRLGGQATTTDLDRTNRRRARASTSTTLTRPDELDYTPSEPTRDQTQNHQRLLELIDSKQSSYSTRLFTDKALASAATATSTTSTRVVGVTAVLLHWKRKKGLDLVIAHLSNYPFIREIIVWNNRPGVDLKPSDFSIGSPTNGILSPPKLRIFNSPSNIHDAGKHFACSLASYSHCYFNDDDWLNVHLDAQYTHYLECCALTRSSTTSSSSDALGSGTIVSNTMPIIHLEHRRWRFENNDLNLHTGFTWLGTGAFAPRQLSTRFLQQQSAAPVLLTRDQSMLSDMYFSLWTNSYPQQMPNNLVPIDVEGGEVGWSRGADVDQWAVVYANILDAVRKLYDTLALQHPSLSPDPFPTSSFLVQSTSSDTRAPCANDGCLFLTSMSPFPPPDALHYPQLKQRNWFIGLLFGQGDNARKDKSLRRRRLHDQRRFDMNDDRFSTTNHGRDNNNQGTGFDPWLISHIKQHEQLFNNVEPGSEMWEWPSDNWWTNNGSWHLAVDGKGIETCWESWKNPDKDDHFGLSFVVPRFIRTIRLIGSTDLAHVMSPSHANKVKSDEGWQVFTTRDDGSAGWEPRNIVNYPPRTTPLSNDLIQVEFTIEPILNVEHSHHFDSNRRLKDEEDSDLWDPLQIDDNGDHVEEIGVRKIKFVSSGPKRHRLRVCGFEIDGWKV